MSEALPPGLGMDRWTGKPVSGFDHVRQSLGVIFTTGFGERVLREWFGSAVPHLLGQLMVPNTIVAYFSAICAAIEMWEPRFRVTKIQPIEIDRLGRAWFRIEGEYRPRGHLGDPSPLGSKVITAGGAIGSPWLVRGDGA